MALFCAVSPASCLNPLAVGNSSELAVEHLGVAVGYDSTSSNLQNSSERAAASSSAVMNQHSRLKGLFSSTFFQSTRAVSAPTDDPGIRLRRSKIYSRVCLQCFCVL